MTPQERRDRKAALMLAKRQRAGLVRQPQRSSDRLETIREATKQRMISKGRQFYYVDTKCPAGHHSRRSVIDDSCELCKNPNAYRERLESSRARKKLIEQARRVRFGK